MSNHPANHVPNPAVGIPQPGTAGRRRVVVVPVLPQQNPLTLFAALVAAVLTLVAHIVIIFLLFNLNVGDVDAGVGDRKPAPTPLDEENKEQEKDLTNDEVGFDSSEKTNFNLDRLEEVSVPGLVTPTESVGLANAPESPARTLPAPPGTGGGQGGGIVDPTQIGTASAFGDIGGMNGIATLGGFAGRSASTREKMLKEGGGNALSEAAVAKGLLWLARHQSSDGRWSLNQFNQHAHEEPSPYGKPIACNCGGMSYKTDGDLAATAFALLPFLAAGITHRPATVKQQQDYQKTVSKGLDFIISKQARDGNYGGGMYSHGLVTIAMCEAYGMTSDPKLKLSAQKAINFIVAAQTPSGENEGGWRYEPRQGGDTSVVGWQLMAIKSGQMAGLSVPQDTLRKAEKFLNAVEDPKTGTYKYTQTNAPTPTMTAVALLCRLYLGSSPRKKEIIMGVDYLSANPPHAQTNDLYYLYYATQVMHHFGRNPWKMWNDGTNGNPGIRDLIISKMDVGASSKTSHQLGSWAPTSGGHVTEGGRIMATSLSLLTLEVYYRHLPLYGRDLGMTKDEK